MESCIICTDNLNTIDMVETKCNHKFHMDCLNKWLLIKPICPYCREDILNLIDPRTNEMLVYSYEQDEYDENYEYGGQPIIMPNISIIFLLYYYVFFKLFGGNFIFLTSYIFKLSSDIILIVNLLNYLYYIYFYKFNSNLRLNFNSFITLIIMYLILNIYLI